MSLNARCFPEKRRTPGASRKSERGVTAEETTHPYVVVVSQDCDLEQDARARRETSMDQKARENALVPHVLLLVASTVEAVRSRAVSSRQWERVKQNKDERFQFLSSVASNEDTVGLGSHLRRRCGRSMTPPPGDRKLASL
jgi:hypothetical protein